MDRSWQAGWLPVAAALALVACRQEAPSGDGGRTLTVVIAEPSSLDPAFLQGTNDFQVAANLHAGLFANDPASGQAVPAMADSYDASPDGLTWTFALRPGMQFADGQPVAAEDFVRSWTRILDPSTGSPGADALYFLKGARAFNEGKGGRPGVEAVAPLSLRVELEDPQPYLPEILASPRLAPVSAGLAGAGAYAVSSWERRQRIVLTLNPHHPWRRPEAAQTVVVRPATSEDSALAWFESGQADVVMGLVPAGRTRELQSRLGRQLVKAPMRSEFYFMFNLSRPDALALDARRVFAAAMDREGLVGQVLAGGQVPAYGYVPDAYGDSGPGNLRCPGFAAGHARAGHAAGSRPLELMSNGSETLKTILEFTEQSLKAAGFSVTLRLMEWKTFLGLVQGGDFDVARYSLTGGPDPIDFFENFTTGHPNNVGRFSLSAYDALVAEARGAADRADRNRILARAHALLCDALPAVPVYFSSQLYLVRESLVDRFRPDPEGVANWDRL